jgi:hypothetical protein
VAVMPITLCLLRRRTPERNLPSTNSTLLAKKRESISSMRRAVVAGILPDRKSA